jgi:hypothetical protein
MPAPEQKLNDRPTPEPLRARRREPPRQPNSAIPPDGWRRWQPMPATNQPRSARQNNLDVRDLPHSAASTEAHRRVQGADVCHATHPATGAVVRGDRNVQPSAMAEARRSRHGPSRIQMLGGFVREDDVGIASAVTARARRCASPRRTLVLAEHGRQPPRQPVDPRASRRAAARSSSEDARGARRPSVVASTLALTKLGRCPTRCAASTVGSASRAVRRRRMTPAVGGQTRDQAEQHRLPLPPPGRATCLAARMASEMRNVGRHLAKFGRDARDGSRAIPAGAVRGRCCPRADNRSASRT